MFCIKCGKQLNDSALFCNNCGTRVDDYPPVPQPVFQPEATSQRVSHETPQVELSEVTQSFVDTDINAEDVVDMKKERAKRLISAGIIMLCVGVFFFILPQLINSSTSTLPGAIKTSASKSGESGMKFEVINGQELEELTGEIRHTPLHLYSSLQYGKTIGFSSTVSLEERLKASGNKDSMILIALFADLSENSYAVDKNFGYETIVFWITAADLKAHIRDGVYPSYGLYLHNSGEGKNRGFYGLREDVSIQSVDRMVSEFTHQFDLDVKRQGNIKLMFVFLGVVLIVVGPICIVVALRTRSKQSKQV